MGTGIVSTLGVVFTFYRKKLFFLNLNILRVSLPQIHGQGETENIKAERIRIRSTDMLRKGRLAFLPRLRKR